MFCIFAFRASWKIISPTIHKISSAIYSEAFHQSSHQKLWLLLEQVYFWNIKNEIYIFIFYRCLKIERNSRLELQSCFFDMKIVEFLPQTPTLVKMLGKWWWWTPLGLNIRKQGLWNIVTEQVMIPFREYINCSPALAWSRQLWCMTAGKYSSFESHRLHISTHDFNPHWYQRIYLFQKNLKQQF